MCRSVDDASKKIRTASTMMKGRERRKPPESLLLSWLDSYYLHQEVRKKVELVPLPSRNHSILHYSIWLDSCHPRHPRLLELLPSSHYRSDSPLWFSRFKIEPFVTDLWVGSDATKAWSNDWKGALEWVRWEDREIEASRKWRFDSTLSCCD